MKYKLELTPCEQSGLALIHKNDTLHYYTNDKEVSNISDNVTPMELHAIVDAPIKKGDWFLVKDKVYKHTLDCDVIQRGAKLIVMTTNKSLKIAEFPITFIINYIRKYNRDNVIKEIELEKVEDGIDIIVPF